mmetsp:Transcript_19208/g.42602  ORF Transcript_19208/g.42602 Transcript_19208/m.42602 type:complete len:1632 (+) Transcript_19208:114-5009(+)
MFFLIFALVETISGAFLGPIPDPEALHLAHAPVGFLQKPQGLGRKAPFELFGCQQISDATLSLKEPKTPNNKTIVDITPLKCYDHCVNSKTLFFATRGDVCMCMDHFEREKVGKCDRPCSGVEVAMCGGQDASWTIYSIGAWLKEPKQKDCGAPPSVAHSAHMCADGGPTTKTRLCPVVCKPGYALMYNSLICDFYIGKWFGGAVCDLVQCNPPTGVPHAAEVCTKADAAKHRECDVKCQKGYTLTRNDLKCSAPDNATSAAGFYTGMAVCEAKSCGAPAQLEHAIVSTAEVVYPNRATYGCERGYTLSGQVADKVTFDVACGQDGKFEKTTEDCKPVACGIPPKIAGSEHVTDAQKVIHFGEVARYSCPRGSTVDGSPVAPTEFSIPCRHTGDYPVSHLRCRRVNCGLPPRVSGADIWKLDIVLKKKGKNFAKVTEDMPVGELMYDREIKNDEASKYQCSEGYSTDPRNPKKQRFRAQCHRSGNYEIVPSCRPLNCGSLPKIKGARYKHGDVRFGSPRRVVCQTGYTVDGQSTSVREFDAMCKADMSLDVPHQFCKPVICGKPPKVFKATLSIPQATDVHFPQALRYECEDGYSFDGTANLGSKFFSLECPPEGVFPKIPSCLPVDDCIGHSCGPYGTCVDREKDYDCDCKEGYKMHVEDGEKVCGVVDDCGPEACGTGVCKDLGKDSYTCDCPTGHQLVDIVVSGKIFKTCRPKDCGAAPASKGASPHIAKAVFPQHIDYHCHHGYTLTGEADGDRDFAIECLDTGKYTAHKDCKKVTCGTPPKIGNSSSPAKAELLAFETLEYTCSDGYSVDHSISPNSKKFTVRCHDDGTFTGEKTCQPVSCGRPPEISYADVPRTIAYFGDTIRYECQDGYSTNGNPGQHLWFEVKCQASGELEDNMERCKPVKIGAPPTVKNAAFAPVAAVYRGAVAYPQQIAYTCQEGYTTNGKPTGSKDGRDSFVVSTTFDGKFTGVQNCTPVGCGEAPKIENAKADKESAVFGESVMYTCAEGYAMELHHSSSALPGTANKLMASQSPKQFKVECLANSQYAPAPKCLNIDDRVGHTCGRHGIVKDVVGKYECDCEQGFDLEELDNGELHCGKLPKCPETNQCGQHGVCQTAHKGYKCLCADGYQEELLPGDEVTCAPVSCGSLPNAKHAKHDNTAMKFPNVATYTCDDGYSVDGTARSIAATFQVVCRASGQAVGATDCIPISCGVPEQLPNTVFREMSALTFGKKQAFECVEGYTVTGIAGGGSVFEQTCTKTGEFSVPETCKAVNCGVPPRVEFAETAQSTTVQFPGAAHYQCKPGYTIDGKPTPEHQDFSLPCLKTGKFQALPAELQEEQECKPVVCGKAPQLKHGSQTTKDTLKYGDDVFYECATGYTVDGTVYGDKRWRTRCTATGKIDKMFTCQLIALVVQGAVRDVTDNTAVEGAKVVLESTLTGESYSTKTDVSGRYIFHEAPTGKATIKMSKGRMVDAARTMTLSEDRFVPDVYLSPVLPSDGWRIELNWGSQPKDLDAHFICGACHLSHLNERINCKPYKLQMALDVDAHAGRGPETVTLMNVGASTRKGNCRFEVVNYSKSPGLKSRTDAVVTVFNSDAKVKEYRLGSAGTITGETWEVFQFDPKEGKLL